MIPEKLEKLPPPPGVIGSLRAGFDVVSSHVTLILIPILLDVFLWLGPRLSTEKLFSSFVSWMIRFAAETRPLTSQEIKSLMELPGIIGHFNWAGWMRTFPIGLSSLKAFAYPGDLPAHTPLGSQAVVQVGSAVGLFGWTFLFILLGWVLGGLYFRWVSMTTLGDKEAGITPLRAIIQTFLLSIAWMAGGVVVLLPFSFLMLFLTTISPLLSNTIVIVILILSYWLIVPLFFTPHGIFARKQNALYSVLSSLRMSRFTLPTSGMFVFSVFLLARGLGYLWSVPKTDSWMTLVGISGHAFVTTSLLAASLVYYRDMNSWIQHALEQLQQKQSAPTQRA